ncbi:MAG: ribokinase, partial [Clostridiales bacterium]|nr:ribokinase [Clostridiales bacterium]
KLGEKGSVCYDGTDYIFCPAFNTGAPVVDTTAAGDCYMAALCSALNKSKNMEKAMYYASVAAGISVTKSGAAPSMPYLSEVEEAINKFNREGRF